MSTKCRILLRLSLDWVGDDSGDREDDGGDGDLKKTVVDAES